MPINDEVFCLYGYVGYDGQTVAAGTASRPLTMVEWRSLTVVYNRTQSTPARISVWFQGIALVSPARLRFAP